MKSNTKPKKTLLKISLFFLLTTILYLLEVYPIEMAIAAIIIFILFVIWKISETLFEDNL